MGRFSRLGNDLYEGRRSVDFVGKWKLWYAVSGLLLILCVGGLWMKGLNLGIEFKGGVSYTVTLPGAQVDQQNVNKVIGAITGTGLPAAENPTVTTSGTDAITAKTEQMSNADSQKVIGAVSRSLHVPPSAISAQAVGASWGSQVASRALTGLCVFLVLVVLFIWIYFREWKMSVGALVALFHDLLITVGVYAISGFEVTPSTVTGVLTILGFSLYDTVVIFDKVKENTANLRRDRTTYARAANLAVNQSLVRSINTSIVALLPVAAILYVGVATLGSGSLRDLALSLFVGMLAGAYSSIFIATPLVVHLKANESQVVSAEKRERARRRREADRYAGVPTFHEGMPVDDEPEELRGHADARDAREETPGSTTAGSEGAGPREPRTPYTGPVRPEAMGSGRTAPTSKRPMRDSGSGRRSQPSRTPRSRRHR